MGRIALFVVAVGGVAYFVIDLVASRVFRTAVSPVIAVSLAVLLAVVLWTSLIWWAGDRLGATKDE